MDSIRAGRDSFGAFELIGADCTNCEARVICVRYSATAFHEHTFLKLAIKQGSSILKKIRNPIGVNCGCYGKFHRQMAHIADRRTARRTG